MAKLEMKLDLDTSDLDAAMVKAERLKAVLEQVKKLQREVAEGAEGTE